MRVRNWGGGCSDPLTVQGIESQYDMITSNIKRVKIAAFEPSVMEAKIQIRDSYFASLRSDKFLQEEHLAGYVVPLTGYRAITSLEYAPCSAAENTRADLLSDNDCAVFRLGPNCLESVWILSFHPVSVSSRSHARNRLDWFHLL